MIISLGDDDLIASGGRQNVFSHPHNQSQIIKVPKDFPPMDKSTIVKHVKNAIMPYKKRLWIRDAYDSYRQYMTILATSDMCPNYIAGHHGFVQTTIGVGCVFEKVCDEGGSKISLTVDDIIRYSEYRRDELTDVIDVFFDNLYIDRVYISDLTLENLCVVRVSSGKFERIVLIDGLGHKTLIPLSVSRSVYTHWHQKMRTLTHARIEHLVESVQEVT